MQNFLLEKILNFAIVSALPGLVFLPPGINQNRVPVKTDTDKTAQFAKFSEYRGVRVGMVADEARQKLGKPKSTGKHQDFYVFSETESAQIFYDDKQTVYAISVDYNGKSSSAPSPIDVFGRDIPARLDGSMYQMQQYADEGYWVSYNRTTGESPLITVTIQKMPSSH